MLNLAPGSRYSGLLAGWQWGVPAKEDMMTKPTPSARSLISAEAKLLRFESALAQSPSPKPILAES